MQEISNKIDQEQTYKQAHEHWCSVTPDVNGMLGGFERLHMPDINGSRKFIEEARTKVYNTCIYGIKIIKNNFEIFINKI